jgi:hypothetical protein
MPRLHGCALTVQRRGKAVKYSVLIGMDASYCITVEASSEQEAGDIATLKAHPHLCHQCSHSGLDLGDLGEVLEVVSLDSQSDAGAKS